MVQKRYVKRHHGSLQEADGDDVVENTYTSTVEQYGNLLSQFDGTDSLYHQYDALGSTDALLTDAEVAKTKIPCCPSSTMPPTSNARNWKTSPRAAFPNK